jgi:hypothetical protein
MQAIGRKCESKSAPFMPQYLRDMTMRTIKWLQLLALLLVVGGCSRNEPLTQEALEKELAAKQSSFSEGIQEAHSGRGEASPSIEITTEQTPGGEASASETPTTTGAGVSDDLKAPDGSVSAPPSKPSSPYAPLAEETPANSGEGVVVDKQRGDLGIRAPGMPEGYSVPYDRDSDK